MEIARLIILYFVPINHTSQSQLMYKILSINPGSTSTKFAFYEDESLLSLHTIKHTPEELLPYKSLVAQCEFRKNLMLEFIKSDGIKINDLSAAVGRGGFVKPIASGVYVINDAMIKDLKRPETSQHASNLGAIIAREIADTLPGCLALIADPVVVDEMQEVARISGLPSVPRRSMFHALNHKAVARKYAAAVGATYESLNLVIAHLGGGISVAAHQLGKVIDLNQALDGYGPFSPERAGTLDAGLLINLCFDNGYTKEEVHKMLIGNGGLMAHLGTNDVQKVIQQINDGESKAQLVLEAMAYNVAKEIGSLLVVLKGKADAVILTGGIAHSALVVNYIKSMISPFVKVIVYPGEDEMEALAMSGLRVLRGEVAKEY